MPPIAILPPEVAAKIAAGEVITRPAAVVKELLENSLDAGAANILIHLEDGGCSLIRVVDDGCGMSPPEVPLSLERHATSKLRQETDLLAVATLGFRGEALPSIAAVSRLTLRTRVVTLERGVEILVEGGTIVADAPWAGPAGTSMTVAELFYNTPVRRTFMRSKAAEQGLILELVRQLALAYPGVHLTLTTAAKTLLNAPPQKDLRARVAAVLGLEVAQKLLPVALVNSPYHIQGLISPPDESVATQRFQFFTVNGRLISDRLIAAALREAYRGLLPRGRQPAAVLHLTIPPEQVDVNVHPTKAEVRFKDSGRLYALILNALRQALNPLQGPGRQAYRDVWEPTAALPPAVHEQGALPLNAVPAPPRDLAPPAGETTEAATPSLPLLPRKPGSSAWRFADLAILGQLHAAYILAQAPEGLILIDQHAAHERVLYENLATPGNGAAARQTLLFPQTVELGGGEAAWLQDHLNLVQDCGLEVEHFGGTTFLITAVPACLAHQDVVDLVQEAVTALAPGKSREPDLGPRERLRQMMACRGAIKAGQELAPAEMAGLLGQLDSLPVSSHCPHGRPLWRLIHQEEIRQMFLRPRQ